MESNNRQKWLSILFFSVSGLVFGISFYLITAGAVASPEPTPAAVASAANVLPYTDEPQVKIVLQRDTRLRLGNLDITYRGVEDHKLRLEVVVRDLDPQYAYQHAITLDMASRGFQLAGVRLKLLSARNSRAKLLWDRQG
jgi:hypothetical protein